MIEFFNNFTNNNNLLLGWRDILGNEFNITQVLDGTWEISLLQRNG